MNKDACLDMPFAKCVFSCMGHRLVFPLFKDCSCTDKVKKISYTYVLPPPPPPPQKKEKSPCIIDFCFTGDTIPYTVSLWSISIHLPLAFWHQLWKKLVVHHLFIVIRIVQHRLITIWCTLGIVYIYLRETQVSAGILETWIGET